MIVPAHLRAEPHLVLQYGHDLPIPILDLEVDEHGVRATLSFSKHPERTLVPWSAVYVVTCDDGRGVLYQEDVPEDVSIIATHPRGDRLEGDGPEAALESLVDDVTDEGVNDESDAEVESTANGAPARSSMRGTTGPSGRISERLLRSVPIDEAVGGEEAVGADQAVAAFGRPAPGRRRRKPQLRLVK